ncbi:MAG: amidase [Acidimicrobiales bacterium]
MDEVSSLSALELAAAIQARRISSREALDALLARVEALDGPINSVVTIDAERARAEAAAADEALAKGAAVGPLHGVPITVKDSFSTAGMRTTSGAPELSDHVPSEDAWPVARLREAGAVVYGKTNLPIYAGDMQSYNEVFGVTNNPWDHSRSCGGSSGGSAAALAAGFTPLELGSDIGGSIRLPAHMCGVVGHKPSYGIVPAHGQIPGPPGTLTQADLAVAGPMARTVEDCVAALGLIAGADRWNRPAWRLELPAPAKRSLAEYRVAAWLDDPHCPVAPDVARLLDDAAGALVAEGAVVDHEARPAFTLEKATVTFFQLLQAALAGGYPNEVIERFAAETGDSDVAVVKRNTGMRHRQWLSANERRLQLRKRFEEFFESGWDALLLPVMPCTAVGHDHSEPQAERVVSVAGEARPYLSLTRWMAPAGACWLPATVIPVGVADDGLPVGIQIVAPYLHDLSALDLGGRLLDVLGGCPRPEGF